MASVITLAEDAACDSNFVGDGCWIEAGVPFTVHVLGDGSSSHIPESMKIYGSLDGTNWKYLFNVTVGPIAYTAQIFSYPHPHNVNYIRYQHIANTESDPEDVITVKMIQPNFKKVDVASLPA